MELQSLMTGVTHIIDESKKRKVYHVSITETYIFDENEPDIDLRLIDKILYDLGRVKDKLEKIKSQRGSGIRTKDQSDEPEL